jgi:CRISPR-associated protein (TIGR02710 family)
MRSRRALIVTVGTGTRPDVYIVKPLIKTIQDSRPDFLVLVVTPGSEEYGKRIAEELRLEDDGFSLKCLNNFDDFQAVFRQLNEVFRDLAEQGFPPQDTQLDFTSGTKAMSAGAVCSAISNKCRSIKYITGERQNGVVIDSSERFLTLDPLEVFAIHDISLAAKLVQGLRFSAAEQVLSSLNARLLDSVTERQMHGLRKVAQCFEAWDVFNHTQASKVLEKIDWSIPNLDHFKPRAEARTFLASLSKSGPNTVENQLVDLFNNAVRRGIEGKFDDAVARLYRTTELFAQQILLRPPFEIDSSNVDLSRVPNTLRERLAKNRGKDDAIQIGLMLDYELLAALNHPAGRRFKENSELQSRLMQRNGSILAHGVTPISRNLYKKLRDDVAELISLERPEFVQQARAVQFPWLVDQCGGDNG